MGPLLGVLGPLKVSGDLRSEEEKQLVMLNDLTPALNIPEPLNRNPPQHSRTGGEFWGAGFRAVQAWFWVYRCLGWVFGFRVSGMFRGDVSGALNIMKT